MEFEVARTIKWKMKSSRHPSLSINNLGFLYILRFLCFIGGFSFNCKDVSFTISIRIQENELCLNGCKIYFWTKYYFSLMCFRTVHQISKERYNDKYGTGAEAFRLYRCLVCHISIKWTYQSICGHLKSHEISIKVIFLIWQILKSKQ